MNRTNPRVDEYLLKAKNWQDETKKLRAIALDCGLTEDFKWRFPCYTYENGNIIILQGFKEYCALMFFKGALLKDPAGILVKIGENTQAGRQVRFSDVEEIIELEPILKSYIQEAIEVEKAGLNVEHKKTADYKIPEEFQNALENIPGLKNAFEALTPGRQRAYILHFSQPKQSQTRTARVEKHIQHILDGKGLSDR